MCHLGRRGPMLKRSITSIPALLSLSGIAMNANARKARVTTAAERVIGVWGGLLTVGAASIRLQMTIRRDSAGGLAGVMKSLDQGGIEARAIVEARGDTLSLLQLRALASASGTSS